MNYGENPLSEYEGLSFDEILAQSQARVLLIAERYAVVVRTVGFFRWVHMRGFVG